MEKNIAAKNIELHAGKNDFMARALAVGPTLNSKKKRDAARLLTRRLKKEGVIVPVKIALSMKRACD